MDSTSVYDPSAKTWAPGPMLSVARAGAGIARVSNGVLVVGGRSTADDPMTALGTTDLVDVGTGTRSDGPMLITPRAWATVVALTMTSTDRILAAGGIGADGTARGDAEILSSGGPSHVTGMLAHARALAASALLPGGEILLAGGTDVMGATWTAQQIGEIFVDPLE
jgi:hypothetical protein